MDLFIQLLREEIGSVCEIFDSRTVTRYPLIGGDGLHYDSIIPRAIGQAVTGPWSQAVFEAMSH
jgi:hypothetical protein